MTQPAAAAVVTPLAIRLGDSLPFVEARILDADGNDVDMSSWVASLNYGGENSPGTYVDPRWEFPWDVDAVNAARDADADIILVNGGEQITLLGPRVIVYEPGDLWASPNDVASLLTSTATSSEVIAAILDAQAAIASYTGSMFDVPVPILIQEATAVLAAQSLNTAHGGSQSAAIIAENIADYTVRYASPTSPHSGLFIDPDSDVGILLRPWRPSVYSVFVGPGVDDLATLPVAHMDPSVYPPVRFP